ncbi:GyrI-like domain-containing protein [Muriicola soli]|uniref:AraC family transcriptional regulator n=1 Tax=Muriicola soli TaxID=2507538 RepID=A0A411E9A1_9FLAO|nr:GyrI-like domain-containing protein [Muriicola soli]QBA64040.1 AraC family transcriptional regulator [Muriicola soli]
MKFTGLEPRLPSATRKRLIGQQQSMSIKHDKTADLFKSFMPKRGEIENTISENVFSINIYKQDYFTAFDPNSVFEKWAAVEVSSFAEVPYGMNKIVIPAGLYAIFDYKGHPGDKAIFQFIFGSWLPGSEYHLDHRPHFEILGERYKNNDPNSEEEIWIPIRPK